MCVIIVGRVNNGARAGSKHWHYFLIVTFLSLGMVEWMRDSLSSITQKLREIYRFSEMKNKTMTSNGREMSLFSLPIAFLFFSLCCATSESSLYQAQKQ